MAKDELKNDDVRTGDTFHHEGISYVCVSVETLYPEGFGFNLDVMHAVIIDDAKQYAYDRWLKMPTKTFVRARRN